MANFKDGCYNEANTEDVGVTLRTSPSVGSGFSQIELKKAEALDFNCKNGHDYGTGNGDDGKLHMERRVGLLSGTALIVGTMIGSGIFVSPKGLLQRTGSVGLSLVVWAACGALSLLGALAYAELGTMITKSGAEYSYFLEAFGSLSAFIFSWVSIFILKPSMLGIICLSFAEYVVEPFVVGCEPPSLSIKFIGAFTIAVLQLLHFLVSFIVL